MTYRRKTDQNQSEVKSHLERIGYEVLDLSRSRRTSIAVAELVQKAFILFGGRGSAGAVRLK